MVCTLSFGQRAVTTLDKNTHLQKLKKGVLLIRLSEQSGKIKALQDRGQTSEAESLQKETAELNELIVSTFNKEYTFSKVHYIYPETSKQVLMDRSKPVKDVISGEEIDLSTEGNIYFTGYGHGNPTDGFERYNRKGFQIFGIEDGKIVNLGRDLFYAGVKQGFFVGSFGRNMVKTIQKLNRRLASGSKYANATN